MKTLRFITSVIIAALALSASADVTWLETTHDFGAFQEDLGPVSCQFRFVNTCLLYTSDDADEILGV